MRAVAVAVTAMLGVLGLAGSAQAYDFSPSWGLGHVEDNPFNDPAGGALLPVTQVYPRGWVKDRGTPDGWAVKMVVTVTGNAGQTLHQYEVKDANAVYRPIDKRVDVAPNPIASVLFELCRTNPERTCVSHRISRPAPPTPQPGATPTPTPTPAPAEDRDGDGVFPPADCIDTNSSVFPGAREIPGNGLDDDCSGGDQPAKMPGVVSVSWSVTGRSLPRLEYMRVREALPGAQVVVACDGRRCPFKQRVKIADSNGDVSLTKLFKRRLRSGVTLDVAITAPSMIAKVTRYTIKRGKLPRGRSMCLPVGATEPQKRC